jgi:hypothetical protein
MNADNVPDRRPSASRQMGFQCENGLPCGRPFFLREGNNQ